MRKISLHKTILTASILTSVLLLSSCSGLLRPANDREVHPSAGAVFSPEMKYELVVEESAVPVFDETAAVEPEVPPCSAFLEAEIGSSVTFSCYVQAKEAFRDNTCSLFAQDETGACYLDRLSCIEDDYDRLTPGQKILITGYKSTWGDDIELTDSHFAFLDGSWLAEPLDVTAMLGTEEISAHRNEKVCFRSMTIESMMDGVSVWYRGWDNAAAEGEDTELFFRASSGGTVSTFSVCPSLCEEPDQVIQTLKSLRLGDTVDLTGYLYWYNEARPRITEITPLS